MKNFSHCVSVIILCENVFVWSLLSLGQNKAQRVWKSVHIILLTCWFRKKIFSIAKTKMSESSFFSSLWTNPICERCYFKTNQCFHFWEEQITWILKKDNTLSVHTIVRIPKMTSSRRDIFDWNVQIRKSAPPQNEKKTTLLENMEITKVVCQSLLTPLLHNLLSLCSTFNDIQYSKLLETTNRKMGYATAWISSTTRHWI